MLTGQDFVVIYQEEGSGALSSDEDEEIQIHAENRAECLYRGCDIFNTTVSLNLTFLCLFFFLQMSQFAFDLAVSV